MPIYEYSCVCCKHEFEIEQSINDKPLDDCPECLVSALKRLIPSNTGFVLKGGCWAKDMYASNKEK